MARSSTTPRQEATAEAATWSRRLIDAARDFVCLCQDGLVTYVNPAGCDLLGYDLPTPMIGNPIENLVHADYADVVKELVAEGGGCGEIHPIKFQRADGTGMDVELLIVPGGDAGLVVLQAHDITERLRASEAVLQSENRYRELVDSALDLTCVVTDGKISFINAAGVRVMGAARVSDLIGREVRTLVHPDYQALIEVGLEHLIGETCAFPLKFVRLDGEPIDVQIGVMPFGQEKGTFMMEVHDITEQLRSASEIQNREQRLRGIMETVADAVITIDEKGIIQTFNPAAEKMFGYNVDEAVGQNVSLLMAESYRNQHQKDVAGYATGKPSTVVGTGGREDMGQRKDGSLFPIELAVTQLRLGEQRLFTGIIRDITKRKQDEEALRRAHDELELRVEERTRELTGEISERKAAEKRLSLAAEVIENLTEGVVITDSELLVTDVNRAFTEITGYQPADIIGKKPHFFDVISDHPGQYADLWSEIDERGRWQGELWNLRKDGERFAERLSLVALRDEKTNAIQQYAIVTRDITKRKQDEERIRYQANYDALTGLPNRALFTDRLHQALPTMSRAGRKLSLLFLDLDGFKLVNDTLGHDIGDMLLKEASKRLLTCVRDGDTVARLGGDEFTVIMPNLDDAKNATVVGRRILDALSQPFTLNGHEAFVSGSIGITTFPDDAADASELIRNADAAMYRAKEQGKDNYQFYTADLNEEVKQRLVLKNGLIKALERSEFSLFYQPKLTLKTDQIVSVEALMRWNSPDMGMVSPAVFVPIMEETGMVVEVGEWALRTACLQHKAWLDQGLPPVRIAVNLSARQIREPSFVNIVDSVLKEVGIEPSGLEIEITESMLMSDATKAVVTLRELHDMGLHIAMDDFGTGYSSLSYLKRFPIDTIKIDRSFVADIVTDEDDAEIIKTILNMGQNLNRKVVAEGVEDQDQLNMLKRLGCDEIQGYFFSQPLPADKATAFIHEHVEARRKAG